MYIVFLLTGITAPPRDMVVPQLAAAILCNLCRKSIPACKFNIFYMFYIVVLLIQSLFSYFSTTTNLTDVVVDVW